MKIILFLLLSFLILPAVGSEEFVQREVSGERQQHVAVSHFFFEGNQCFGARREYSNLQMHVISPEVYWDIYYEGTLIATADPDARSINYAQAPEGMVLTKSLSRFTLSKGGKIVRVWDIQANELRLLPDDELARLNGLKDTANPEFKNLLESFSPRFEAPTLEEAKSKMKKTNKPAHDNP